MARPRSVSPPDDEMVALIGDFIAREGRSPTVREFQDAVGLASVSAAHRHLLRLGRLQRVTRQPGRSRTVRPVQTSVSGAETTSP